MKKSLFTPAEFENSETSADVDSKTNAMPPKRRPELSSVDSRCGLHCTGCEYKITCGCSGCIETEGHPFHGECPVAVCCQSKGHLHCGECPNIPCELLTLYSCDPEHGDDPHGARIEQCRRWAADNNI